MLTARRKSKVKAKGVRKSRAKVKARSSNPFGIKRPGRVRAYMKRKYGSKAFTKKGTIKVSYLKRAINAVKNVSLKRALVLALNFKTKIGRGRRR